MLFEERDETVANGPVEVKVQTLGRGRGQGAYENFVWPTTEGPGLHTCLSTAQGLVPHASLDILYQNSTIDCLHTETLLLGANTKASSS